MDGFSYSLWLLKSIKNTPAERFKHIRQAFFIVYCIQPFQKF